MGTDDTAMWALDAWRPALERFGRVTRLTVALYDTDGLRTCGPVNRTPLFDLLAESDHDLGLFAECTERCLQGAYGPQEVVVAHRFGLAAIGTALTRNGTTVGVAVAGYHLSEFPDAIAIERLAREGRRPAARLWDAVRQETPASVSRIASHGELLQVLVETVLREHDRSREHVNLSARLQAALERLRASEERLRLIVESVADYGILTLDPSGRITSWNLGAERIFGYSAEEAIGQPADIIFTLEDRGAGAPEEEMRRAAETGRAEDERWHVDKAGRRFYISGVLAPLAMDGVLAGYVKVARDVTQRKALEEALRRAHDELEQRVRERTLELAQSNTLLRAEVRERHAAEDQIKALLKRIITSQEEERRKIARDIHDHLGQQMTALRLSLEALCARSDVDPSIAEPTLRTQQLAEELDRSIDFLTWELRPASLDHFGLSAALRHLVTGWSERFGIPADYGATGTEGLRLAPEVETNLYRVAQEALHNVVKHAEATRVSVLLEWRDRRVVLVIEDNGRGFIQPDVRRRRSTPGLGLVGMRERAVLVGGELEIESSPGGGTTIFVRVPLRNGG
jgi:PAS domain S-box-containing protein